MVLGERPDGVATDGPALPPAVLGEAAGGAVPLAWGTCWIVLPGWSTWTKQRAKPEPAVPHTVCWGPAKGVRNGPAPLSGPGRANWFPGAASARGVATIIMMTRTTAPAPAPSMATLLRILPPPLGRYESRKIDETAWNCMAPH